MKRRGFATALAIVLLTGSASQARATTWTSSRSSNPARTIVSDSTGKWVATFTDRAYTVTLAGPARTFSEATAGYAVKTSVWVRTLPAPFTGTVDEAWLSAELEDRSPDVLALAMQYVAGAPSLFDATGLRIAGDASYGPLQADGTRQEGSDFNDYLGIPWSYGTSVDQPENAQYGSLDCSGFMRMLWGYRTGLALTLTPNGTAIPRRAFEIYDSAPGIITVKNSGRVPSSTARKRLVAGDLVFFDASTDDGTKLDHVGMYLGRDTAGNYRFISSRKTADGPTLGDVGGKSTLNGTGFYATAFRSARRL